MILPLHGLEETSADREMMAILEMQAELMDASEDGAGEETLLILSQRIAERYEHLLQRNPDYLHGWILCGKFLRSIGADARALAAFRKAQSLDPDLAIVHEQVGLTLADLGEVKPALAYLLRAVEMDPEEAVFREDLGRFLLRHGTELEADGAIEEGRAPKIATAAFEEAFRLEPTFARGWQWAESFADSAEPGWEDAAAAWSEVLPLAPTQAAEEASRLQLARALIESEEFEKASEFLEPVETDALRASRRSLVERLP